MIGNQRYASDLEQAQAEIASVAKNLAPGAIPTRNVRIESSIKRAHSLMELSATLRRRLQATADLLEGVGGAQIEGAEAAPAPAPHGTLNILDGVLDELEREISLTNATMNRLQGLVG